MAIVLVVGVRDLATNEINAVWSVPSRAHVMRSFTDEVNRESQDNMVYHHPADFELWMVGEFDTNSGLLVPGVDPERILRAADVSFKSVEKN